TGPGRTRPVGPPQKPQQGPLPASHRFSRSTNTADQPAAASQPALKIQSAVPSNGHDGQLLPRCWTSRASAVVAVISPAAGQSPRIAIVPQCIAVPHG